VALPMPKCKNFKDLTKEPPFDRLTVIAYTGVTVRKTSLWLCRCICGVEKVIAGTHLISGHTRSCGCLNKELTVARNTTHGLSGIPAYKVWDSMLQRCRNPRDRSFANYGGRGIGVCERWEKFENFLGDMGEPPPGMTLDRRENDGDYTPENCKWATRSEQMRNTRQSRILTFKDKSLCVVDWAEILGIDRKVLYKRLDYGWSVEKTLSTPVRRRR
jgi:hypothetical protein